MAIERANKRNITQMAFCLGVYSLCCVPSLVSSTFWLGDLSYTYDIPQISFSHSAMMFPRERTSDMLLSRPAAPTRIYAHNYDNNFSQNLVKQA